MGDERHHDPGDQEPDGQEVEGRDPVEQVLDQEERAAPRGCGAEQRRGGEQGGSAGRHPPTLSEAAGQISDSVTVEPLGSSVPAPGSIENTKPRPR